jgi:hypothetical protein
MVNFSEIYVEPLTARTEIANMDGMLPIHMAIHANKPTCAAVLSRSDKWIFPKISLISTENRLNRWKMMPHL